ncbi:MAG TPA: hypothetical protein VHC22_10140 [Pirellulales bacterium]|nr:hypothetical protein [Pirellulales bacterium]
MNTAIALFPRLDRAKRAVEACVRSDAVDVVCKKGGAETAVQPWRLRFVLNDPSTWKTDASVYHLRLTAGAREQYAANGQRFVEDLFQH